MTGPSLVKCQVALSASLTAIDATGGAGTIRVATQPECAWTAATEANWISAVTPASGQGSGEVAFQVPANPTTASRQGDIVINDSHVRIEQAAASCVFEVTPQTTSVDRLGGAGRVTVSTAGGCSWNATSQVSWITLTSPASGSGSGTFSYDIAENTGPARSGALTVAGQTTLVSQAAGASASPPGCTFVLRPTSLAVPVAGGVSTVTVAAGAGCTWSAASATPWITITSGVTGNGEGTVTINVEPNSAAARAGVLSIAGHTFNVTQAGADVCAYTISPASAAIAATGGNGSPVSVSTTAGCAWFATSNASWITVTSGANGSGSGSVGFSVATNTGGARSETITIAGQSFTVTQAAATAASCAYAINPTSQLIGAEGGTGAPVAISTTPACAWSATSTASWITVTSGSSGSGGGSVGFSVATNTGSARTGSITIGSETFIVMQAAAASCAYAIVPTSQSVGADGGAGTPVAVSATAGCAWTATSNDAWIVNTTGSGSGSGTVGFTVAANPGGARTGTLTIAGQTFTVTQAGVAAPCTYQITPTSTSMFANGGSTNVLVSTAAGCAWTASVNSNATWLSVISGSSGAGQGTVILGVAANKDEARTGTVTIAGQVFTVSQEAAASCKYDLKTTSITIGAAGSTEGRVDVSVKKDCAWTARTNDPWIVITSGASGEGDGTVRYTVLPNLLSTRTGTITIAGQTFTVIQTGLLP